MGFRARSSRLFNMWGRPIKRTWGNKRPGDFRRFTSSETAIFGELNDKRAGDFSHRPAYGGLCRDKRPVDFCREKRPGDFCGPPCPSRLFCRRVGRLIVFGEIRGTATSVVFYVLRNSYIC